MLQNADTFFPKQIVLHNQFYFDKHYVNVAFCQCHNGCCFFSDKLLIWEVVLLNMFEALSASLVFCVAFYAEMYCQGSHGL